MAIIGTFTQNGNGLTGSVKTLTLNAKVRFVALEKDSDKAPDYRVIAGTNVELGAAWMRTSKEGRSYHSVKLDDPSLPALGCRPRSPARRPLPRVLRSVCGYSPVSPAAALRRDGILKKAQIAPVTSG